jgi:hypothetical protein
MTEEIKPSETGPVIPAGGPVESLAESRKEADRITRTKSMSIVSRDLADLGTPGVWVEVEPDVAEQMGAFEETAVTRADVEADDDGN